MKKKFLLTKNFGFLFLLLVCCCIISYNIGSGNLSKNDLSAYADGIADSVRSVILDENKSLIIKSDLKSKLGLDEYTASIYAPMINQSSMLFNVDWKKIASKIKVESNFDPFAESIPTRIYRSEKKESALGILQIKPTTAKEICEDLDIEWRGERMLYNPAINIRLGTYYYAKMELILNGNFESAEKAYNVGLSGFKKGYYSEKHWQRVKYIYAMLREPEDSSQINKDLERLTINLKSNNDKK